MSGNTKELKTYVLTSPIIKKGDFTDSKGRKVKVTDELIHDIFDSLSTAAPCPMKDSHDLSNDIGDIKKYELRDGCIYQRTLITDNSRFENRYNNGHCYVSPELEFEYDSRENVINAKLLGAALTNNPGMIDTASEVKQHHFEAATVESTTNDNSTSWQEPLGELKSTVKSLNDTLTTFGEQVKNMSNTPVNQTEQPKTNESPNMVTMGVDDLAKLVNDAVEKRMAAMSAPQPTTPQPNPEASEAAVKTPTNEMPDEMAKKYADMLSQVEDLKNTQEKAYKKQLNGILGELKSMGMDSPEKMIPDGLTTEQKITVLESIKENFAKHSPMSAPLQEPLANVSNAGAKKGITIDDVMANLEAGNDPSIRHQLMKLSDSDLMAKFNMNVLFDSNGTYIGPM